MATRLPKRIAYLAPVIEQLATIVPDELNEDNEAAFTLVRDAVRQRIAGHSRSKAERTLESDADALNAWLAQPGQEQSPAHFVSGAFLGILGYGGVEQLQGNEAESKLPPPTCMVAMDPPEGFKTTSDCLGWMVLKRGDLQVVVTPSLDRPWNLLTDVPEGFYEAISATLGIEVPKVDMRDKNVSFGNLAKGKKRLCVINRHEYLKNVDYVLEVPGGWVHVCAQSKQDFDDSILESRFHTLHVVPAEAGRTAICPSDGEARTVSGGESS